MNTLKLSFGIILFSVFISFSQSCSDLPKKYKNYEEALTLISTSKFPISEEVDTRKSSWIKCAKFYSCDQTVGYLILCMGSKSYIFANVPISIWEQFKNADSFGSFYNSMIRGRYFFKLE